MNKLVKGSIAGAAGIALLLGGAGTLAFWNDSADVASAASIATGTLKVDSTTAGSWSNGTITNYVPGDSNVYTETFTVTAVGDNLEFTLDSNVDDLVGAAGFTELDVTEDFTVTLNGNPVTTFTGLAAGVYTVVVEITVDFPWDAAGNNTGNQADQSAQLDLSNAAVTVTQTP